MDGLGWERPQGMSMHYYSGGADLSTSFTVEHMNEQLTSYAKVEEAIVHQRAVLDSYEKGKEIGLILDEWGVWDKDSRRRREALRKALAAEHDAERRSRRSGAQHLQPPSGQIAYVQHRADG
jgi:alpha-L-arabinofuranosidase